MHASLVAQVLHDTVAKFKAKLKDAAQEKKRCDERIAELEAELERLAARCKDLVEHGELSSEVKTAITATFQTHITSVPSTRSGTRSGRIACVAQKTR